MTRPTPDTVAPTAELHALSSGVTLHALHWPAADGGGGHPFVLTHGLASNARLWDGVARRLAARGHPVVTVDQRGHGRSSKPDDGYDIATCADDLALLLDTLLGEGSGIDRPPIVAGQSWGGNVVLELGRRHPDRVAQIVCVDGGFIDLRARFPVWDAAATALAPPKLAGTPVETIDRWLTQMASDWPEEGRRGTLANFEVRDDGTIAPWLTFDRHLVVLRGLWEHEPSSTYPHVPVPVLLIAAEDPTADTEWSRSKEQAVAEAVAALPRARAHWFRPAHHDVHAQQPDAVADLLHRAATDPAFYDPVPEDPVPEAPRPEDPVDEDPVPEDQESP